MDIKAYAKVNLILNIKGKRPDGYHEIETLMQTAPLHDNLSINVGRGSGIWINGSGLPVNCSPSNLVYRAAALMSEKFDKSGHIVIDLEKNIPIAAGLGGGSSDAAAVIFALSKIWEIDDEKALYSVASSLGSDIAFCLGAQLGHPMAIGRGRGEILEFVSEPPLDLRLTTKNIHVRNKTAEVYKELKPEDYSLQHNIDAFFEAKSLEEKNALLGNHLQAPALRVFKRQGFEIEELSSNIDKKYHLSGAGPTIFTII